MGRRKNKKTLEKIILGIIVAIFLAVASNFGIGIPEYSTGISRQNEISYETSFDLESIPEYKNEPYVVLNNNEPEFEKGDYTTEVFEEYSDLDYLGRCGVAFANVCRETMPTEERESLEYEPTGWKQKNIMENIYIIVAI